MPAPKIAPFWIWVLTVLVALAGMMFQRLTAPSFPLAVEVEHEGAVLTCVMGRSSVGAENQRLVVAGVHADWEGELLWRSFEKRGVFRREPMRNLGEMMVGELPLQTRGTRVEYRIELDADGEVVRLPSFGTVMTRFKGATPFWVAFGHVLLIFLGLLFAARAGLEALTLGGRARAHSLVALLSFSLGGLLFGVLMKSSAYGRYWSGLPTGFDGTDNKTLVLLVAWSLPLILHLAGRRSRGLILLASLLTVLAFFLPHTVLGGN